MIVCLSIVAVLSVVGAAAATATSALSGAEHGSFDSQSGNPLRAGGSPARSLREKTPAASAQAPAELFPAAGEPSLDAARPLPSPLAEKTNDAQPPKAPDPAAPPAAPAAESRAESPATNPAPAPATTPASAPAPVTEPAPLQTNDALDEALDKFLDEANPETPAVDATARRNLTVWMEWGGGEPSAWRGVVRVVRGRVISARSAGFAADSPGSIFVAEDAAQLAARPARNFDCARLELEGEVDASLRISLAAANSNEPVGDILVPFAELARRSHVFHLDTRGNRLIVRRAADDEVRFASRRESLVFQPGESFDFAVLPNPFADVAEPVRCRVQLLPARSDWVLWTDTRETSSEPTGTFAATEPFVLTTPQQAGAYDLRITTEAISTADHSEPAWQATRHVQIMVAGGESRADAADQVADAESIAAGWRLIHVSDPARSTSADRATLSPGVRVLPGDVAAEATNARFAALFDVPRDGWLAIPLDVSALGEPLAIEVDVPNDVTQTIGVALLEPGADGRSPEATLDTGIDTPFAFPQARGTLETHRVVCWPKSAKPLLLLTHRGGVNGLRIGAVRIYERDTAPVAAGGEEQLAANEHGRLLAAWLEHPLWPAQLGATTVEDPASGRQLQDWITFHEAGRRLVRQLNLGGYNAAVVPVVYDGGAIYPSEWLEATPRGDTGVFFTTGQDPVRKDVLELLLRLFDESGKRFIPAIRFSGTLPELEAARRRGTAAIELTDAEGRRPIAAEALPAGGPFYNPLTPEVQQAMRRVVVEVVARCAAHPSFAGVAIQLDRGSYAVLPGTSWGADPATQTRFLTAIRRQQPAGQSASFAELEPQWLAWRAHQLSLFYGQLQQDVARAKPDARLFLAGGDRMAEADSRTHSAERFPEPTSARRALLELGIDPELLQRSGVVLLRPHRHEVLPEGTMDAELATSAELDALFNASQSAAGGFVHYPRHRADVNLDQESPGAGLVKLTSHVAPAGLHGRRHAAHALAAADAPVLFDGGWMTPRHSASWHEFCRLYRALPARNFTNVPPATGTAPQPVVLRRRVEGERTYFYLVNDSPWYATATLEFAADKQPPLESLTQRPMPQPQKRSSADASGATQAYVLPLEPYEMLALTIAVPDAQPQRWQSKVDGEVLAALEIGIREMRARLDARRKYEVLDNTGFEFARPDGSIPGWRLGGQVEFARDPVEPQAGKHSLRLMVDDGASDSPGGVAWLRSEVFAPPSSGRLALTAWLRTDASTPHPEVRMLVEGDRAGHRLRWERRFSTRPVKETERALPDQWLPYVLAIDELPEDVEWLRVGLDVRGQGQVWLDTVALADVWLSRTERASLEDELATATENLERGAITDCVQFFHSLQSQYLLRQFPLDAAVTTDAAAEARDETPEPAGTPTELTRYEDETPAEPPPSPAPAAATRTSPIETASATHAVAATSSEREPRLSAGSASTSWWQRFSSRLPWKNRAGNNSSSSTWTRPVDR